MIRGLVGTPYFVEWIVEDGKGKAGRESPRQGVAPGKPGHPAPGQALTAEEVLRRAHRGPCFHQKIPAHLLSGPYQATITVRLENETVSSEEFQSPSSPPKEAVAQALRDVDALWNHVEGGAKFMELKPLAQDFMKHLAMLAPAGFADDVGSFEKDRQWCLSRGRAIGRACDEGNTGLVQNLSGQCKPRLHDMQEFLESRSCPGAQPEGCDPVETP
jgi:hypothetical protein